MSQLTRTVSMSWGLTVGWNIAPPPPGPTIRKLPGRSSAPVAETARIAYRRNERIITLFYFRLLSLRFDAFLCVRKLGLCQRLRLGFRQAPGSVEWNATGRGGGASRRLAD